MMSVLKDHSDQGPGSWHVQTDFTLMLYVFVRSAARAKVGFSVANGTN